MGRLIKHDRPQRGRPPKPFLEDPDRHIMALATAYQCWGCSRKGAIEYAVAVTEGIPTGPNPKPGWGRGIAMADAIYEMKHRPGAAYSVTGRGRTVRQKLLRWLRADRDGASGWLGRTALLWAIAIDCSMVNPPDPAEIERLIALAAADNESDFCRDVLIPLARREGVKKT